METKNLYEFGPFRFDPVKRKLLRHGQPVSLRPKSSEVLLVLVERAGDVVSKDELIKRVWRDTKIVGENYLAQCISDLREALNDTATNPEYIQTVPGEGYRFIGNIREMEEGSPERPAAAIPPGGSIPGPQTPGRTGASWGVRIPKIACIALAVLLIAFWFWRENPKRGLSTQSPEAERLYDLARQYDLTGDESQAITALEQAISIDPNFGEAYLEIADIYDNLAEREKAIDYVKRAERLTPSLGPMFKLRLDGLLAYLNDDAETALRIYQVLTDRYPKYADGYSYRAVMEMDLYHLDEAEQSLKRCLDLDSGNVYCHYNLLYVQILTNRFDDVIAYEIELRKTGLAYPWFDEPLGLAVMGKDDLEKAKERFERLAGARIGGRRVHGTVHSEVASRRLADLALYQGRFQQARLHVKDLLDEANGSYTKARYHLYLSDIETLSGNRQEAINQARMALSESADRSIVEKAAKAFARNGESPESASPHYS